MHLTRIAVNNFFAGGTAVASVAREFGALFAPNGCARCLLGTGPKRHDPVAARRSLNSQSTPCPMPPDGPQMRVFRPKGQRDTKTNGVPTLAVREPPPTKQAVDAGRMTAQIAGNASSFYDPNVGRRRCNGCCDPPQKHLLSSCCVRVDKQGDLAGAVNFLPEVTAGTVSLEFTVLGSQPWRFTS